MRVIFASFVSDLEDGVSTISFLFKFFFIGIFVVLTNVLVLIAKLEPRSSLRTPKSANNDISTDLSTTSKLSLK